MTLFYPLISVLLAILTASLATEILLGSWRLTEPRADPFEGVAVVVVPAHDEEQIIGVRLRSLVAAAEGQATILVIADNCSDRTAVIAREFGVQVHERFDSARRGKGYALAAAKQHLQSRPPDVVVVIDADCWTDRTSLQNLIGTCHQLKLPVQAAYLQAPSMEAPITVQLSTFAFFVKNFVRQRGLQRLARRSLLVGSGMAFPWRTFAEATLATSNIVEDLELGLDLAARGEPPQFLESAVVWGPTETQSGTRSQRERWEGGFLKTALVAGPALVLTALRKLKLRDAWAGFSLSIPPLTFLVTLDCICLAGGLAFAAGGMIGGSLVLPLLGSFLALISIIGYVWLTVGRRFVPAKALIKLPLYLFWKITLYVSLLWKGAPTEWRRTER